MYKHAVEKTIEESKNNMVRYVQRNRVYDGTLSKKLYASLTLTGSVLRNRRCAGRPPGNRICKRHESGVPARGSAGSGPSTMVEDATAGVAVEVAAAVIVVAAEADGSNSAARGTLLAFSS